MRFSDDILMAFADGELPDAEAEEVREALAADPALRVRVERFHNVRRALRATYDEVTQEPLPERFRALLGDLAAQEPVTEKAGATAVVNLGAERSRRLTPPTFMGKVSNTPNWTALAASLIIGVLVGRMLLMPAPALLSVEGGQLRAGAALTRVLDARLGADADNGADRVMHIGVSFRTQDGHYCRTFDSLEANKAVSGLACREQDAWIVRIATTEAAVSSDYRQAGSAAPAVMDMVDHLIAGDPLNDAQERDARARAWRG